ncbi:hypothetical protein MBLNU457_6357t1 [Dothideomycetes sp. NU457]
MAASSPKDPGHPYAETKNISFTYHAQQTSPAPFGYDYFISLPPSYTTSPSRRYPLILFLHGAGESQRAENESYASIRHGIPKLILCYDKFKSGLKRPSISIPQAQRIRKNPSKVSDRSSEPVDAEVCALLAENFITVTPSLDMRHGYGWNVSVLSALLDEVVNAYRVDLDAVHITGFSMGGYGTWALGIHSPARFASLMPVCGGGDMLRVGLIKDLPQWVHHGVLDDVIPVGASEKMVSSLRNKGAREVRFTKYEELKHDCWTEAYGNMEVYEWMLRCRRRTKGEEVVVPEANKVVVAGAEKDLDGRG